MKLTLNPTGTCKSNDGSDKFHDFLFTRNKNILNNTCIYCKTHIPKWNHIIDTVLQTAFYTKSCMLTSFQVSTFSSASFIGQYFCQRKTSQFIYPSPYQRTFRFLQFFSIMNSGTMTYFDVSVLICIQDKFLLNRLVTKSENLKCPHILPNCLIKGYINLHSF